MNSVSLIEVWVFGLKVRLASVFCLFVCLFVFWLCQLLVAPGHAWSSFSDDGWNPAFSVLEGGVLSAGPARQSLRQHCWVSSHESCKIWFFTPWRLLKMSKQEVTWWSMLTCILNEGCLGHGASRVLGAEPCSSFLCIGVYCDLIPSCLPYLFSEHWNILDVQCWVSLCRAPVIQLYIHSYLVIFTEKGMTTHSSTLAWKILWTGEPGRLQSTVTKSRTRLSNFTFPFHFHALEKKMATDSSVLAWRIPGTGGPGGLPSMGSPRVGRDWRDSAAAAAVFFRFCSIIDLTRDIHYSSFVAPLTASGSPLEP